MGSHSVTCHPTQVNAPHLNPGQTGRYSIYLPQRDWRLSWPFQTVHGLSRLWPGNRFWVWWLKKNYILRRYTQRRQRQSGKWRHSRMQQRPNRKKTKNHSRRAVNKQGLKVHCFQFFFNFTLWNTHTHTHTQCCHPKFLHTNVFIEQERLLHNQGLTTEYKTLPPIYELH